MNDQPRTQAMNNNNHKRTDDDWKKPGCSHDCPAEHSAEQDNYNIIKRCSHSKGPSSRYPDENQRNDKNNNRPATHLDNCQVFSITKNIYDRFHKKLFSALRKMKSILNE